MKGKTVAVLSMTLLLFSCASAIDDEVVVFLGASITENFYYPSYGVFFPAYDFHKVIVGGTPDKSSGFGEVGSYNPDMVTFKECAAYFDEGGNTDLPYLHQCMEAIADYCDGIGAIPVPATTFPVDVGYGGHTQAQLDDIVEFNVWVRDWCSTNGWACMDYYDWIADGEGQLPTAYHDGDGLHPNQAGYNVIGPHVIPCLNHGLGPVESTSFGSIKAAFK